MRLDWIKPDYPLVWVNPQSVTHYTHEPHLAWFLIAVHHAPRVLTRKVFARVYYLLRQRMIYSGRWDLKARPFRELEHFKRMKDLDRATRGFRSTRWYRQARETLVSEGAWKRNKRVFDNVRELD